MIAPLAQTPVTIGLLGGAVEALDSELVVAMVGYRVLGSSAVAEIEPARSPP